MSVDATLQSAPPTGHRDIDALGPWFHNLHLPDGRQTSPSHTLGDFPRFKWSVIEPFLPRDMRGWRALDVGCNAGFYSFELAKRGAIVTGIDLDDHYLAQARWAAERFELGDRVQFVKASVYEAGALDGPFDIIWFMGVLYHLRHPLLAIDILASQLRRLLVFQSLMIPGSKPRPTPENLRYEERHQLRDPDWPAFAFIEHRFAGDPTNWWAPNVAGAEAMLRAAQLRIMSQPEQEIFLCEPTEDTIAVGAARVTELAAALRRR